MNPNTHQQSYRGQLLVIDDETEILKALKRQFKYDYDVHIAATAAEGYQIMTEFPIQVIISDQRMPGMSGAEFFNRVKGEFPDAMRLLLTGYADIQAVIGAINDGNIFRYITKPWEPVELDTIVRQAFERYQLIIQNRSLVTELSEANVFLEERVVERTVELEAANEHLITLNLQKDRFVGMAAHDIRGPIGSVRGCADLLLSERLSPSESKEFVQVIRDTSQKILHLVNDLLDITAIQTGKLSLQPRSVAVDTFLQTVWRLNRLIGEQKGITLELDIQPGLESTMFDTERIEQVLDNLIGNAFKFSPTHTVVRLSAATSNDYLVIKVTDQGPGIHPDDIHRLFAEFSTTRARPTGGEQSSGLGLSICKRIVELHGGTIQVKSDFGKGSTFEVTLPYVPVSNAMKTVA
ncbi:MAG: hybrid sensor histidine kinase/response regulator [Anaerolineae bacterium]|nr:hybrid sensor histidine kinase/response regulator [Anaerolineae bacterium]